MSIVFKSTKFMYDNIPSDKLNLRICTFNGHGVTKSKEVSDVSVSTTKTPNGDKWNFTKVDYNSPLTFTFSICKRDYTCFSQLDRRVVGSWLQSKSNAFKPMQFFCVDYSNIIFYAKCTSLEKFIVDGEVLGYNVTFTTNAPYGYTLEQTFNINATQTVYSTIITNTSDEIDVPLYPKLEITVLETGDFGIKNENTQRLTNIRDCYYGEIITMEPEKGYIYSNVKEYRVIDDFNHVWFSLVRDMFDTRNTIVVSGKSNIKITCSYPRKVGV